MVDVVDALERCTDLLARDGLPDPSTWDRTVSLSLLLSDPADFEGGDLIVNGKAVPLARGQVAGFTAVTPHLVTPLTAGRRAILVGFGEVAR